MAVLFFTTAAFFGRSGVISASLCVSVQAPLTAQTVGGVCGGAIRSQMSQLLRL